MSRAPLSRCHRALGRADGRHQADRHDGRRAHRSVRHHPHGHHGRERRQEMGHLARGAGPVRRSKARSARDAPIEAGHFKSQIMPIELESRKGRAMFDTDEHVRCDASGDMGKLKPAFVKENGTVTAGNASGINDGAAAVVLMEAGGRAARSEADGAPRGLRACRRRPEVMGIGPVPASRRRSLKAGLKVDDIDVIESNEAFAAQACAVARTSASTRRRSTPTAGHRARPSDRRDRRDPHRQGDVRAAAHGRPLRAGHDVHRRRPGHRRVFERM